MFGGEDVQVSVCDVTSHKLTFVAKPPKNPYQIAKRHWTTACCFVPQSNGVLHPFFEHKETFVRMPGQLLYGGNAEHELFLYDIRCSRRPVFSIEPWREARVTCVCPEENGPLSTICEIGDRDLCTGYEIWTANAMGYVDRFDLRKKYIKGSIKHISRNV